MKAYRSMEWHHDGAGRRKEEEHQMLTVRNLGGAALFLFGTTFMWLTTSFASEGVHTGGTAWTLTNVLSLLTLLGLTVASWGLFQRSAWWEPVAVVSSLVGVAAVVPYWLAADHAGEAAPGFNVVIHLLGSVGVLVLLLVPTLEAWVSRHVMSG